MKLLKIKILFISIFGAFLCVAQDFQYESNKDSAIIKQLNIVECITHTTYFINNEIHRKSINSIERYNEYGLVVTSIELYNMNDTSDIMDFNYNEERQITSIVWKWFDLFVILSDKFKTYL